MPSNEIENMFSVKLCDVVVLALFLANTQIRLENCKKNEKKNAERLNGFYLKLQFE